MNAAIPLIPFIVNTYLYMDANMQGVHKTAPVGSVMYQTDRQTKTKIGSNLNNPWPCVKVIRYEDETNKPVSI